MLDKFIILNEKKQPIHKFSETHSFADVKHRNNLGIKIEKPFLIVDVDSDDESEILYNLLKKINYETLTMKTDRGRHFWFSSETPLTNNSKNITPLGIYVDIKSWGKNTLACVKKNGVLREWEKHPVRPLPLWLKPMDNKFKRDFKGLTEGEGRNDTLFRWILPLLNSGFEIEGVREVLNLINIGLFKEPLPQHEITAMIDKNVAFEKIEGELVVKEEYKPKLLKKDNIWDPTAHNIFGKNLAKEQNLKAKYNQIFLYDKGEYINDETQIERLMINRCDHIKTNQRKEIMQYLRLMPPDQSEKDALKYINCKNGLFNLKTYKLEEHNEDIFEINQINADFNPMAYSKTVDDALNAWVDGDIELRHVLEEVIGYSLVKNLNLQKAIMLLGWGGNGKSTFLDMLKSLVGTKNISTVSLEKIHEEFITQELAGKLINIGGDINDAHMQESGTFKMLAVGESFTVNKKYSSPFVLTSYATQIYSTNTLPTARDRSDGFFRRWLIVPFNHSFKNKAISEKTSFEEDLHSDLSRSYLLNLGLVALKRLEKNKGFTQSKKINEILSKFKVDNNNAVAWIEGTDNKNFIGKSLKSVYINYKDNAIETGQKPFSINNFRDYILRFSTLDLELHKKEGFDGWYFKLKDNLVF